MLAVKRFYAVSDDIKKKRSRFGNALKFFGADFAEFAKTMSKPEISPP